jgi:hypothetical protein
MASPNWALSGAKASSQSTDCSSAQNGADSARAGAVIVAELTINAMLERIEYVLARTREYPRFA